MLNEFENKVERFIASQGLLDGVSRLLLAVSGGADSVALLAVMVSLKAEGLIECELCCGHVHHHLRSLEADGDADYVRKMCERMEIKYALRDVDVKTHAEEKRLSIETAARQLRIEALIGCANQLNCESIATAHHADDNAETVVHRLLRGTGFRGLCGIWPVRELEGMRFVRPLLGVRRNEIESYLNDKSIEWRTDRTNEDCRHKRNFIRHRLLPALQADCDSDIAEEIYALSQGSRRYFQLIRERVDGIWDKTATGSDGIIELDLENFLEESEAVRVEMVRRAIVGIGCGERDITEGHYRKVLDLAEGKDTGFELPGGHEVLRDGDMLLFREKASIPKIKSEVRIELAGPGSVRVGSYEVTAEIFETAEGSVKGIKTNKGSYVERFDLDKVVWPIVVRSRAAGDRFVPFGFSREKKIGKFLTAEKLTPAMKEKVLVVEDSEKIIWLWPVRMSEQAKISGGTGKILQLSIHKGKEV